MYKIQAACNTIVMHYQKDYYTCKYQDKLEEW